MRVAREFELGGGVGLAWAAALSFLLTSTNALAFRTGRDLSQLSETSRVVYGDPPLRVFLVPNPDTGLSTLEVERAAVLAAEAWIGPECAAPAISFDGTTLIEAVAGDGVSTIEWVGDWKSRHLPSNAAATTDVQYVQGRSGDWEIAEADIYLNAAMEWSAEDGVPASSPASDQKRDLRAVLTHEFGHALGLLHPCELDEKDGAPACGDEHARACMNPVYDASQRDLADDDIEGLCYLYPAAGCEANGCADGFVCTDSGCRLQCGDEVCSKDQLCVSQGCVAKDDCSISNCEGSACAVDAECGRNEFCSSGSCRHGRAAIGDRCRTARDCVDGSCLAGACAIACSSAVPCSGEITCDIIAGACLDGLKQLGDACDSADDCRAGYCLQERKDPPVCTRACGGTLPECPEDWACTRVESENVCVPLDLSVSGGASCSLPNRQAISRRLVGPLELWLSSALLFIHLRRAQRRARHSPSSRHGIHT